MSAIKIHIHHKSDPPLSLIPEDVAKIASTSVEKVAILEGGMASGKTSLMFVGVPTQDGTLPVLELSLVHLETIFAAAKGADLRFQDLQREKEKGEKN